MDLFGSPGFLINRLAHLMANELERAFKAHGVTTSQWAVLAVLWQREGIPQVELQQKLRLEGATVTGILQRMEQAGMIRREPDATDKRVQLVYLTKRGSELKDALVPIAVSINQKALHDFTEEERAAFQALIVKALHNMNF